MIEKANLVFEQNQVVYLQNQQIILYVFCSLIALYIIFMLVVIPVLKKKKDDKNFKKRMKLYQELKPGHEVFLASGVFGELVDKQGEIYFVEIAPKVVIKVNRNYILGFFDQEISQKINEEKTKKSKG
ncbi:preprotein translocase subunit YajC [Mycoplasmopsis alligatoris]|uniref:Putative preprotein translocase, YajC subunit n=1 Tax=Mycoplasmopsis alligatoris A21JP2 TaxID=747682 RepID=D4XVV9_9BACT|nr:preprotein translocase subunit YajC [Mycoplasmopsis alligatoris]EFF41520.1 putative preprotein translocase, YajC subunit [Mycoplasmopsis alligatoris A21JP2]